MKTYNVALLLVLAVFHGVRYTEQTNVVFNWEIVHNEDGTIKVVDADQTYTESEKSLAELKENVHFSLYSNTKDSVCSLYLGHDDTLTSCKYDRTLPTRIVIHGWNNDLSSTMCTSIRDAYLAKGNYNVIIVHWDTWASKNYISSRMKVAPVGQYTSLLIDWLVTSGMKSKDLIVVGHSLGAHIAGVACRNTTAPVGLLVGLDPAGPLFYGTTMNARMTKADADFVVVLHTSAGKLGYDGDLGDIDFWANGGSKQPGCGSDTLKTCAHGRAYEYYAEAIKTNGFTSRSSSSYKNYESGTYLGKAVALGKVTKSSGVSGDYYFDTNSKSPYSKN